MSHIIFLTSLNFDKHLHTYPLLFFSFINSEYIEDMTYAATWNDYTNKNFRQDSKSFAYNEWDLHPSRCGVALRLRTVRTKAQKLTLELSSGAGEMYDLAHDPFEMNNLFGDLGYRSMQRELSAMINSRPDDALQPLPEPIGLG